MKAKKVAAYGILVALAIALSYLENLIPWTVAAPGVKLGLANTVTIFALYRLSFRDACAISLLRVLLVGILFGNAFSLAFSAAGAIVIPAGAITISLSGLAVGSLVGIVLNMVLPGKDGDEAETHQVSELVEEEPEMRFPLEGTPLKEV